MFTINNIQPPRSLNQIWDTWGQKWCLNPKTNLWELNNNPTIEQTWDSLLQHHSPLYETPPLMYDKWTPQAQNLSFIYINTARAAETLKHAIVSIDRLYTTDTPTRDKTQDTIEETEFWAETRGILSAAYNTLAVWKNMIDDGRHPDSLHPTELENPQPATDTGKPKRPKLTTVHGGKQE